MAAFLLPLALAPIIGGAMSLAGGALSVTGGVINAGATAAGIAADMAGGVIGAVGGLMGGGQSGNVQSKAGDSYAANSSQGRVIVQARKDREAKAKASKGGMGLAKMKSSISGLGGGSSGAMSMLPTGEESQKTLLGQILGQIRTNTTLLSSMLQVLSAGVSSGPEPTDLINQAKAPKGEGNSKESGKVKKVFSALGSKMKGIASSLGGTAKFLMKGLLGVGALIAFTKYRDNITGFIARTFEMLEGFGSRFGDASDPLGKFIDMITKTGEGSLIASLKTGLAFVIKELVNALKLMINAFLPDWLKLDMTEVKSTNANDSAITSAIAVSQSTGASSVGTVSGGSILGDREPLRINTKNSGLSEIQQTETQDAVREKLSMMYDNVNKSNGRIQWTKIGDGFTAGFSMNTLLGKHSIEDIMASQPIVDGVVRNESVLSQPLAELLPVPDIASPTNLKNFMSNLTNESTFRQRQLLYPDNENYYEKKILDSVQERKMLMAPITASNGSSSTPIIISDTGAKIGAVSTGDQVAMTTGIDHTDRTQSAIQAMA